MRGIVSTAMSILNEKWSILTADVSYTNSGKSATNERELPCFFAPSAVYDLLET
jgi:hypothetical protein